MFCSSKEDDEKKNKKDEDQEDLDNEPSVGGYVVQVFQEIVLSLLRIT